MDKFKSFFSKHWKENKAYIIFGIAFFVLSLVLISQIPLMGDDWMWGSHIGKAHLSTWFEGYNGRYAGNLLILSITRSSFLRAIIFSGFMLLIVLLPSLLLKKKSLMLLSLSALILLITPKEIMMQGVFWSSGFANYVPPTALMFLYLAMIRDSFEDTAPEYTKKQTVILSVVSVIIGFIGALFVENATIGNAVISIAVVVYIAIKHKRVYAVHISYMASTLVGTYFILSNSENSGGYRQFPSLENIKSTLTSNTNQIVNHFFAKGFFLLAIVSILCIALSVVSLRELKGKGRAVTIASMVANVFSLILLLARSTANDWEIVYGWHTVSAALAGSMAFLYCTSVFIMVILGVKDRPTLLKVIACLSTIVLTIAPMLIVNPFGPRCLFSAIIALIIFIVILTDYVFSIFKISSQNKKIFTACFIAGVIAMLFFFISIYSTIDHYYDKRDEYIEKQLEKGYTTITVAALPYSSYTWHANIDNSLWGGRYKLYHEIDSKVVFKALAPYEFDLWAEEFDKGGNK